MNNISNIIDIIIARLFNSNNIFFLDFGIPSTSPAPYNYYPYPTYYNPHHYQVPSVYKTTATPLSSPLSPGESSCSPDMISPHQLSHQTFTPPQYATPATTPLPSYDTVTPPQYGNIPASPPTIPDTQVMECDQIPINIESTQTPLNVRIFMKTILNSLY